MDIKRKRPTFLIYFLIIMLIIGASFCIYLGISSLGDIKATGKLEKLNYSDKAIKLIIKNHIDNYLLEKKIYSKTLEVALVDGEYKKQNLNDYVYFEYKDYDKYIYHLNCLLNYGYTKNDINVIFDHLTKDEIDSIINEGKSISNLTNYITNSFFKFKNLNRYVDYKTKHSDYDYDKIINNVNINHDYDFYTHNISSIDPHSTLVLVNKYYHLENNFVPNDLVQISSNCATGNNNMVTSTVKTAFEQMCIGMRSVGLTIKSVSAYRSYSEQEKLYNNYVTTDGVKNADTYSARPGYSEHQTGLSLDIYNTVLAYTSFDKTHEYSWLKDNAHKYGFIIRYPSDKEDITGYKYEPWHIRYVGIDVATYIYNHGITFDEYYAMFIDK